MSFLLTEAEKVTAQVEYCKLNNLHHFPLQGEARDDCLIKAEAKKLVERIKKGGHALYDGRYIDGKTWQALQKEVEDG